jgi:hypothetical protein
MKVTMNWLVLASMAFTMSPTSQAAEVVGVRGVVDNGSLSSVAGSLDFNQGKKTLNFRDGDISLTLPTKLSIRLNQVKLSGKGANNLMIRIPSRKKPFNQYNFQLNAADIKQPFDINAESISSDLGLRTTVGSRSCTIAVYCYNGECYKVSGTQLVTVVTHHYQEDMTMKFLTPGTNDEQGSISADLGRKELVSRTVSRCF